MDIRDIEERVKTILIEKELDQTIPLDPVRLARLNNIEVKNVVFKDVNYAGAISKKGDKTIILVKSDDPYNRKRFTVAHELGHFYLHLANTDGEIVDMYRSKKANNPEEQEANAFAAALLMDKVLVRVLWEKVKNIDKMAKIFDVSFESMGYRLSNLGLI
ncbi:MAG: ImmA/IrrE family metallo-endopeptidase [Firmicutes bacterium]|nr:ImmA/IrrE family metallo-endopeptidase [Bacillota bacterium]